MCKWEPCRQVQRRVCLLAVQLQIQTGRTPSKAVCEFCFLSVTIPLRSVESESEQAARQSVSQWSEEINEE